MSRTLLSISYGQSVAIEPVSDEVTNILAQTFYTVRHQRDAAQCKLNHLSRRWSPLFNIGRDRGQDYVYVIQRGLLPLVAAKLDQHGIQIKQVGIDRLAAVIADYNIGNVGKQFSQIDFPVLDAVQRTDRAVIRYSSEKVEVARIIAEVSLAWPSKSVIVLAKRVKDAERLKRQLLRYLPDVECYHHVRHPDARCRVAIATYIHSNSGKTAITKRDIVFAMNPADLVCTEYGQRCVNKMRNARIYALIPDDVMLPPHVDDWITTLFGANEVSIPAHGRRFRQVEVVLMSIKGGGVARLARSSAAFPVTQAGRLPHYPFRGLLGVHSRSACMLADFPRKPFLEVLQSISLPP